MDLQKAYPSQLETLRALFNAKGEDRIADKLVRLNNIFDIAESKWYENLPRLKGNKVRYLLLAEAPPWTDNEEVSYFYNTFRSRWAERIWHTFFPLQRLTPQIDLGLKKLADQGFLLVDTLPFSMDYPSSKRWSGVYRKLIRECLPFLFSKITNPRIEWASEVRVALAFKLNGLAVIDALPKGLALPNQQLVKLTPDEIASDGSGFTNSEKLRNIWQLES